jgi:hypothetical protein
MSFRRRIDGKCVEDSGTIDNIEYNPYAGAQKNIEVGPGLEFIAELTAATGVCPGDQLFIFKPSAGIAYVTLGDDNTVVLGTAPAADTFPVFGEAYTRISAADYKYIIGAAGIFLYKLRDDNQERINPAP